MKLKMCQECRHFHQHYARMPDGWQQRIPCGHCSQKRFKHRRPDQGACPLFEERPCSASPRTWIDLAKGGKK